jgi:hypothetical protein
MMLRGLRGLFVGVAVTLTLALAALPSQAAESTPAGGPALVAGSYVRVQSLTAAASNQKCVRLTVRGGAYAHDWTDMCWNWFRNSHGSYNGSYWGTWHKVSHNTHTMYLQANINNGRWVGVRWAPAQVSVGVPYSGDYTDIQHLTFRACITGVGCGHPPA